MLTRSLKKKKKLELQGDLNHWVDVLDRLEGFLQKLCERDETKASPTKLLLRVEAEGKERLRAILRFSRLLLENCTQKHIYNSLEVFPFLCSSFAQHLHIPRILFQTFY